MIDCTGGLPVLTMPGASDCTQLDRIMKSISQVLVRDLAHIERECQPGNLVNNIDFSLILVELSVQRQLVSS